MQQRVQLHVHVQQRRQRQSDKGKRRQHRRRRNNCHAGRQRGRQATRSVGGNRHSKQNFVLVGRERSFGKDLLLHLHQGQQEQRLHHVSSQQTHEKQAHIRVLVSN